MATTSPPPLPPPHTSPIIRLLHSPPPTAPNPSPKPLTLLIRAYHPIDAPSLQHAANNPAIAANMRNTFPSPYSLADARYFIEEVAMNEETWVRSGEMSSLTSLDGFGAGDDGQRRKCEGVGEAVCVSYAICVVEHEGGSENPQGRAAGDGGLEEGKKVGKVIGGIGLKFNNANDVEASSVEVGYWLGVEHWGKHITTTLLPHFISWTFSTFGFVLRVEAQVYSWNVQRSGKCLLNAGFEQVGVLRRKVWKEGRVGDMVVFDILREEWREIKDAEEMG